MTDSSYPPNVGNPDPERQTSPIVEEGDDEVETLPQTALEEPVCYFNDRSFHDGAYVRSGTALLRCERGVWLTVGASDPDNP
ncbi:MAG: DUF1496 domain-containing protein [Ectothiorhodospiraceae bacterium]